jgi:Mn2+/Fe2+ NRAMP family transporter
VNLKELMGRYTNTLFANVVAVATSAVMVVLTVAMIWMTIRG